VFQIDTALNLLWALFCVGALVYHIRSERRRGNSGTRRASAIRALAIFLAVVSLFPCVSSSDDSIRFEYMGYSQSPANHSNESKQGPGTALATLVRLLESLDSVQIPLILVLLINLCFFSLVLVVWRKGQDRPVPMRSGRAPPSVLLPA
jgi:hypothetical protein